LKLFDRITEGMAVIAAAALAAVALSVVYEVVMRYAFGRPTSWVIDFSEYALIGCLFFATAWVLTQEAHIKIDIVMMMSPPKVVRVLTLIASVIGSFACAVFCVVSVIAVWEAFRDGEVIWRSIIVPKWLVFAAMPIGSFMLTVAFVRRSWTNARQL